MPTAEPRLLTVNPLRPARAAVSAAAAALNRGELVILPTDTVYGVAAKPGFEARLVEAKGRDPGKPIPLLAENIEAVARMLCQSPAPASDQPNRLTTSPTNRFTASPTHRFTDSPLHRLTDSPLHRSPKMPARARDLARRFWPGALTLVLPVGDGTEGFRVPDHAVTRAVLAASGGLLRITSANRSGAPESRDAAAAVAALGRHVSVVLDAGPAPGGVASTVVAIASDGALRVLREGALSAKWITDPDIVMMVCTGNTCRSPMAEGLLRKWLGRASSWDVCSAGLAAMEGSPVSEETVEVLRERGIDCRGQTARAVTAARVDAARAVVVMTSHQRDALRRRFPAARSKILLLRDFAPGRPGDDIADPVGLSVEDYRRVCEAIEAAMPELVLYLRDQKSGC